MFNRIIFSIKLRSNVTLRAWTYQCESIIAQRSRRIQQLFTFYKRVYGPHGQPPLRGIMLSAVGAVGLSISGGSGFDWSKERLSLMNFELCHRDIEFINTIPNNKRCEQCQEKQMKYCYCLVGNKKCRPIQGNGTPSVRSCRRKMPFQRDLVVEQGNTQIEAADESPWEPYMSKNEFSIWRREERSAMYSYKVYARFDDITANDLLHVQTDLDFRRQWDETAVTLEMIEVDPQPGTNSHLIYWELQWPKLFANRDYVYCRRFITDRQRKVMMMCNRGTTHPKYLKTSDKVRITDYWSLMVIKPYRTFEEPGVHYMLTYYDDPGLPIPQSIKSWVTQKQMPDFLRKMYLATKHYACKRAHEMKQCNAMHNLNDLNISNDEYTANEERASWVKRLWRQREGGK